VLSEGIFQYPTAHIFGYFGPAHDGPVWPLIWCRADFRSRRPGNSGYPPSGDYIAECITNGFTLRETLILCRRMAEHWNRGVGILKGLKPCFKTEPDRMKDIGIAEALGLQFQSTRNILEFYSRRESLAEARLPAGRRRILKAMKEIVRAELKIDERITASGARRFRGWGFIPKPKGTNIFRTSSTGG